MSVGIKNLHAQRHARKTVLIQLDGDGAFTGGRTQEYFRQQGIESFKIPSYSPDLAPIENAWYELDQRVRYPRMLHGEAAGSDIRSARKQFERRPSARRAQSSRSGRVRACLEKSVGGASGAVWRGVGVQGAGIRCTVQRRPVRRRSVAVNRRTCADVSDGLGRARRWEVTAAANSTRKWRNGVVDTPGNRRAWDALVMRALRAIPAGYWHRLAETMPARVAELVEAEGGRTRW